MRECVVVVVGVVVLFNQSSQTIASASEDEDEEDDWVAKATLCRPLLGTVGVGVLIVIVNTSPSRARAPLNACSGPCSYRSIGCGLSVRGSWSTYGAGDRLRGGNSSSDVGEVARSSGALVQIRTAPSWLPVANMNGSSAA